MAEEKERKSKRRRGDNLEMLMHKKVRVRGVKSYTAVSRRGETFPSLEVSTH